MRRFFAFLSAIALAFLVTGAMSLYQKGVSLREINLAVLTEVFQDTLDTEKPKLPGTLPVQEEEAPASEEEDTQPTLSYEEHMKKGNSFMEADFLTPAANEYAKASRLEPNRVEPYLKLLKANYELRDYKKALRNAETVLKFQPAHYETQLTMARIYVKLSDFQTALGLLENLPTTETPDPRVTYYKGLLKSVFADHENARELLNQARLESRDPQLNEKIDEMLAAYTEFNFAQAAEPLYLSELLGRAYNKVGEYEIAVHTLKEVLKTRSDLRDGWILFGFAYLNLGKYYFAQTAFDRAYELDSEWPTTQYFLGLTHKELGNTEDSIVFFNYALNNGFEPRLVIHRHLADLYFDNGDYDNAVRSYEKVLEANQEDVNAFVRPVWLYIEFLKTPEKALNLSQVAVSSFPNSAMAYNLLGWSMIGIENYVKAEENLKKAIALDPGLAAAHYNLGRLYQTKDERQLALDSYKKAYELDPSGSIGNLAAKDYNALLTQ